MPCVKIHYPNTCLNAIVLVSGTKHRFLLAHRGEDVLHCYRSRLEGFNLRSSSFAMIRQKAAKGASKRKVDGTGVFACVGVFMCV
jgi:hypothetical protein